MWGSIADGRLARGVHPPDPAGQDHPLSTATSGRAREGRVRAVLEAAGCDVIRSAASKGAADLTAVHDGRVLFVQVKPASGRVDPEPWNRLYDLAARLPGVAAPVIAVMRPGVGVTWWLVTGRKDGGRQPWQQHTLAELLTPPATA